jgi:hypothetical protein
MSTYPGDDTTSWPLRVWGLALLGGLAGLIIHFLINVDPTLAAKGQAPALRFASATFVGIAALLFAIVVERTRILWNIGFAGVGAAVVAFTIYWNGPTGWDAINVEVWQLICALLCVAIAAPLFQAGRDQPADASSRFAIPYPAAYHHGWTNVVLWFAAWGFVAITWLMFLLLGKLFKLIGIVVVQQLLDKNWMVLLLTGAALGAGIALLRDREHVLGLLRRVVTTVLTVLAPVLALGLFVFILAIPFTGLSPLWQATKSTTPILLGCVIGALCLINAVVGESDQQSAGNPILRASALALSLVMLPLAAIAAISTGSRVHQYGLTPDRLWAVVFTAIACAYGLAYLVSLVRARTAAGPLLRKANLRLAIGLCLLAFVLSTPLLNFGAMSTADQLARLKAGKTSAENFDWRALRFDFGKPGVAATQDLERHGATPAIRAAAAHALAAKNRWALGFGAEPFNAKPIDQKRLVILPRKIALPEQLLQKLPNYNACGSEGFCAVVHEAGSDEAIIQQGNRVRVWKQEGGNWKAVPLIAPYPGRERMDELERAVAAGKVEIRRLDIRQVYVNGQPVGDPFQ